MKKICTLYSSSLLFFHIYHWCFKIEKHKLHFSQKQVTNYKYILWFNDVSNSYIYSMLHSRVLDWWFFQNWFCCMSLVCCAIWSEMCSGTSDYMNLREDWKELKLKLIRILLSLLFWELGSEWCVWGGCFCVLDKAQYTGDLTFSSLKQCKN